MGRGKVVFFLLVLLVFLVGKRRGLFVVYEEHAEGDEAGDYVC